jgi:hypothetical protein
VAAGFRRGEQPALDPHAQGLRAPRFRPGPAPTEAPESASALFLSAIPPMAWGSGVQLAPGDELTNDPRVALKRCR